MVQCLQIWGTEEMDSFKYVPERERKTANFHIKISFTNTHCFTKILNERQTAAAQIRDFIRKTHELHKYFCVSGWNEIIFTITQESGKCVCIFTCSAENTAGSQMV